MDFLNGSFRIGRIAGIEIRIHVLFVLWAVWRMFDSADWRAEAWFMGMLFGIVLLHELGHCFGARSVGGDASNIMLWPLGGLAFAHAPMTPWAQFVTVAAGPLVNVVFCLISGLLLVVSAGTLAVLSLNPLHPVVWMHVPPGGVLEYVAIFYWVNYWLLLFNLLPIYPLDGGQLFQCAIWPFVGLRRAVQIACQVGLAGCALLGLLALQSGGGILFFIAIFGGFTCWQRLQQVRYGMVVDERVQFVRPRSSGPGFWQRLRARWSGAGRPKVTMRNPNPGAWERKIDEMEQLEREVDRILRKVHERGIHSLSYVERQTLERATRLRQKRELERWGG